MALNLNEFLAIVYADVFDFPLTPKEAKFWQIQDIQAYLPARQGLVAAKHQYTNLVRNERGYLFLKDRQKLVRLRKQREQITERKIASTGPILQLIKTIPTVRAVFLTGSLAVRNARQTSDIDLLIVALPGTLWLTRVVVVTLLKIKGIYRDGTNVANRLCTNIFLDTNHLTSIGKNLYTAHEVLQARCLYDRGETFRQWLMANRWSRDYLPRVYEYRVSSIKYQVPRRSRSVATLSFLFVFLFPLEILAFAAQYLYMRPKITKERVAWGYAYFHPRDLASSVMKAYQKRLRMVGIMDK